MPRMIWRVNIAQRPIRDANRSNQLIVAANCPNNAIAFEGHASAVCECGFGQPRPASKLTHDLPRAAKPMEIVEVCLSVSHVSNDTIPSPLVSERPAAT